MAIKDWFRKKIKAKHHANISCFISFAYTDGREYARKLAVFLKSKGVVVFTAVDDPRPGDTFVDVIVDRIQSVDLFILIGTPSAFESLHVRREVEFASRRKSSNLIIPIMFRGVSSFDNAPPSLLSLPFLEEDENASTLR